jgi:hypothetical protein
MPMTEAACARSCRSRSARRRRDPVARGPRASPNGGWLGGCRHGVRRRGPGPDGRGAAARARGHRHQDAARAPRRRASRPLPRSAAASRGWACAYSSATSSRATPCRCSRSCPSAPATSSRAASPRSASSPTRYDASPTASASWTPRSSPGCYAIDATSVRSSLSALTERDRDVLELMAAGRVNQGICERLVLSPETVECRARRFAGSRR